MVKHVVGLAAAVAVATFASTNAYTFTASTPVVPMDNSQCTDENQVEDSTSNALQLVLKGDHAQKLVWTPCCAIPNKQPCRENTFKGLDQHQNSVKGGSNPIASSDCLSGLNSREEESVTIDITFAEMQEGSCCRRCTCGGDPECVSFEGVEKLWIPCDARIPTTGTNSRDWCQFSEDRCNGINAAGLNPVDADGNDVQCVWNNIKGFRPGMVPYTGSPCVADPNAALSMNMWSRGRKGTSGYAAVDLAVGERGIVTSTTVTVGTDKYVLDAEDCIVESAKPWKKDGSFVSPVGATNRGTRNEGTREQRLWTMFSAAHNVEVVIVCLRSKEGRRVGIARQNVDIRTDNTAANVANSGGFCKANAIAEIKDRAAEGAAGIHNSCINYYGKYGLIASRIVSGNKATTGSNIASVAEDWCMNSYLPASPDPSLGARYYQAACVSALAKVAQSTIEKTDWRPWYCAALHNQHKGTTAWELQFGDNAARAIQECSLLIGSFYPDATGWYDMVAAWGRGRNDGDKLQYFTASSFTTQRPQGCNQGVYLIPLNSDMSQYPEDKWFFIPYAAGNAHIEFTTSGSSGSAGRQLRRRRKKRGGSKASSNAAALQTAQDDIVLNGFVIKQCDPDPATCENHDPCNWNGRGVTVDAKWTYEVAYSDGQS